MALLAKKSGIVSTWPIPMKRSRVFTMHAMTSENVEKVAEPRTTISSTATIAFGANRLHGVWHRQDWYAVAERDQPRLTEIRRNQDSFDLKVSHDTILHRALMRFRLTNVCDGSPH